MPGSALTMATFPPTSALNRLLLPAFGWPARTTRNGRWPSERCSSLFLQQRQMRQAVTQAHEQIVGRDEANVLIGKIERGFDIGEQVEQIVAQQGERLGHAAGKLLERLRQFAARVCLDDAEHRLRAGQIELAGQEGAQREFAPLSGPCAGAKHSAISASTIGIAESRWISTTSCPV